MKLDHLLFLLFAICVTGILIYVIMIVLKNDNTSKKTTKNQVIVVKDNNNNTTTDMTNKIIAIVLLVIIIISLLYGMYSMYSNHREIEQNFNTESLYKKDKISYLRSPGNGDCLYTSMSRVFDELLPDGKEDLDATGLRKMVVETLLEDEPKLTNLLESYSGTNDANTKLFRNVIDKWTRNGKQFTEDILTEIKDIMLSKSYWGDELSIGIIQDIANALLKLKIKFHVIDIGSGLSREIPIPGKTDDDDDDDTRHAFLRFNTNHYDILH